MFRNVQRPVLVGLFVLVLLPVGAGIGLGLAILVERISGLSSGYLGAVVGSVIGTLVTFVWAVGVGSELVGVGTIFTGIRIPPRPHWLPPDQKEE
ncbi:uncharacterized membrane protein YgaE (UPF0421/DUF939 family) [Bradyrhizobium diazoefficiens]